MPKLRFVHAADLHLDSPFGGIQSEAPANVAETLQRADKRRLIDRPRAQAAGQELRGALASNLGADAVSDDPAASPERRSPGTESRPASRSPR